MTPFHKLKGFERRIQEPGPSNRKDLNEGRDNTNGFAASSIARAVKSISEAAEARPTTKLLDPESLPKLDAPTLPFQRLSVPVRVPRSEGSVSENDKKLKRKKKRPLPGKKWRKVASREEFCLEETGTFS